jgi:hypothetical protein
MLLVPILPKAASDLKINSYRSKGFRKPLVQLQKSLLELQVPFLKRFRKLLGLLILHRFCHKDSAGFRKTISMDARGFWNLLIDCISALRTFSRKFVSFSKGIMNKNIF